MYSNDYLEECLKENKGNGYLLRGYIYTQDKQYDELIINDLGFMCNNQDTLQEFKEELIKANVKEFVLTESSSGLMDDLHALDNVNIKIVGVIKTRYIDKWDKKECFTEGLKMEIK